MNDFLALVLAIALILTVIFGAAYIAAKVACSAYSDVTGRETKINLLTCYVKIENQWVARSEVRQSVGVK